MIFLSMFVKNVKRRLILQATSKTITSRIKSTHIENYLSQGGKACLLVVFDRLKDVKEFEVWLTKRREGKA